MKITVSHGKKIPIKGVDFSNQEWHVTVEEEIPDSDDKAAASKRISDLLKGLEALVDKRINT